MRSSYSVTGGVLLLVLFASLFFYPLTIVSLVPDYAVETTEMSLREDTSTAVAETEVEDKRATTTVFLVGDVMLGRHVEYLMSKYGYTYPYEHLGFLIREPAYVIANFEASIPLVHKKTPNFGYVFSVASTAVPALREAGVTHASLANNHSNDYGQEGLSQTISTLSDLGIVSFGLPQGLASSSYTVLELGRIRLGVLAIHALTGIPSAQEIRLLSDELSTISDVQMAFVHWGDEYVKKPNHTQVNLALTLSEAGIDLIVGHHPHVTQSVAKVGDALVFYSLGNFIFDQYFSDEVREGLVLRLDSLTDGQLALSLIPISSKSVQAQPKRMSEKDGEVFLGELALISDERLRENIRSGQFILDLPLATSTEIAIMDQ